MTFKKLTIGLSIVTIFAACKPSSTHIKTIVNQSGNDIRLKFTGDWKNQLGDSLTIIKGNKFQLFNSSLVGKGLETPCEDDLDSLSIKIVVPNGKKLTKNLFNGSEWVSDFTEGRNGGTDQKCTFTILDSDFQ
jgi:hypothetical protein